MADENKLSRRGFLGMLGAVGAAPLVVNMPLPEPAPLPEEFVPVKAVESAPVVATRGTRLEFKQFDRWWLAGEVEEMRGPAIRDPKVERFMGNFPKLMHENEIEIRLIGGAVDISMAGSVGYGKREFRIILNDGMGIGGGQMWEFEGYLTSYEMEHVVNGPPSSMVVVQLEGQPRLTTYFVGDGEG